MSYTAPTQTAETITARLDLEAAFQNTPEAQARRDADEASYKAERRMKAIKRYLKERAAR